MSDDPVTPTRRATGSRDLAAELTLLQLRSVALFAACNDGQLAEVAGVSCERRYAIGR